MGRLAPDPPLPPRARVGSSFICRTCGGTFKFAHHPYVLAHVGGYFYCREHVFPALIESEYQKLLSGYDQMVAEWRSRYER